MPVLILQGGMCHVLIAGLVPQIGEDSDKWLATGGRGGSRFAVPATFYGVNIPTMACFKLPVEPAPAPYRKGI